tara:strand:+ start:1669 stop:2901 length:1233 start_codon:yes stop_codon:yes gene_type:complete
MDIEINNKIVSGKAYLRERSKDFIKNFEKIESYIEREVTEIENLKNSEKSIIPEINFKELSNHNEEIIRNIEKRGCVIIRDVFDDKIVHEWNKSLEEYINKNNFFEDQKKKEGLDKYFSDLKSSKPQIYSLYWSKAQIEIRHSEEMAKVKKWLNNLWIYKHDGKEVFDPNRELIYADRVRRREPGDDSLGLSTHCDAGSFERWTDKAYQKIYNNIFSDNFENYNPFNARYRNEIVEFEAPAVAHVFRTFQGWTALTTQGPNDGTLQLIPIAKGIAYILTRALLNDVPENELCGSKPGRALSINKDYHSLFLRGLISIPILNPGDTIWWHPDVVHAVEDKHLGRNFSNVVYVGASPYCKKNLDYAKKQTQKFLEGKSPPDFAPEDYEVNYEGRIKLNDLSNLAKKQMALED